MKRYHRSFTALITAACLVISGCHSTTSKDYPNRRIQLLVGYGAGGANDSVARAYAAAFEEETGTTMLVVNRPGAGGIIAATEAMLEAPDGYRLFLAPLAAFTSAPLQQDVRYSGENFHSIAAISGQTFGIVTSSRSEFQTLEELKNVDQELAFSTFGEGHATHLVAAELLNAMGKSGRAIPFESSAQALQSVVNGEVDLGIIDFTSLRPRLESGELSLLSLTGDHRVRGFEEIPTLSEAGYPAADFPSSQAVLAPAETPQHIRQQLKEISSAVLQNQDYVAFLENTDSVIPDITGEDWVKDYSDAQRERIAASYEKLGIQP